MNGMIPVILVGALALSAPTSTSNAPVAQASSRSLETSPDHKVDQIVSIFENSTPDIQYSYITALGDGRGYTAGRAGFTTATGDLLDVLERYSQLKPTTAEWPRLRALLPRLRELRDLASGSLQGLASLPALWKAAAGDPKFLRAQDETTETLYKTPARAWCRKLGLRSPLSFLVIYDSIIQHGDGGDADSLGTLISRVNANDERAFIREFLSVRRADLMNPANPDTAGEWRESVDRVDALKRLVNTDNWELTSPLRLEVWDSTYAL